MLGPAWEIPEDLHQGTGFSFRRFLIPQACLYRGRAIYLDADQIVLADIGELWDMLEANPNADLACTFQTDKFNHSPAPQTSVMVMNCERCLWEPEEIYNWQRQSNDDREWYSKIMHLQEPAWPYWQDEAPLETHWNHFNERRDDTKLLHFTREHQQPWYWPGHRHKDLWRDELLAAMRKGYVQPEEIKAAVGQWSPPSKGRRAEGMHPYWEKFA